MRSIDPQIKSSTEVALEHGPEEKQQTSTASQLFNYVKDKIDAFKEKPLEEKLYTIGKFAVAGATQSKWAFSASSMWAPSGCPG